MPAQLVALDDGPNILLDKPILLLGRHPECDIQIESRKISRRHCCIAQVSDYFVVRDLGSTNGVRINGVRVTEGRLIAGDELTIGNHRYQVAWDAIFAPVPLLKPPAKSTQSPSLPPYEVGSRDAFLESSDKPIPLSEASGRPLRHSKRPRKESLPVKTEKAKKPASSASPPPRDESLNLPDDLNQAPSDIFPHPPNNSSSP